MFLALSVWTFIVLLPVAAAVLSSLKGTTEIVTNPLGIPSRLALENYSRAFFGVDLGRPLHEYALNSVIAVVGGTGLGMAVATPAAYALARRRGKLSAIGFRYFTFLIVIPPVITWVPLFGLVSSLHLLSNPFALGAIYAASVVPVSVLLLRSYFASFPLDLIESAMVDGASELRVLRSIVLPMSRGTLSIVAMVQGIGLWNDLALAVILLLDARSQTLPAGLATQFRGQHGVDLGAQFAGLVLAIIPIVVVYLLMERQLRQGIRMGALK